MLVKVLVRSWRGIAKIGERQPVPRITFERWPAVYSPDSSNRIELPGQQCSA
jgi:hypothetical protein